jgi:hypothetical protein
MDANQNNRESAKAALEQPQADHTALLAEARDALQGVASAMPFPVAVALLRRIDAALGKP